MDFKLFGKEGASTLMLIHGADIHYWHGSLEAFVAKPQVEHLKKLYPDVHVEVFPKMNHGQLLVDHPEKVATRIKGITDNHYC